MTTPETCEHMLVITSSTEPSSTTGSIGRRTVHMVCSKGCGYEADVVTTQTDEEIQAEWWATYGGEAP